HPPCELAPPRDEVIDRRPRRFGTGARRDHLSGAVEAGDANARSAPRLSRPPGNGTYTGAFSASRHSVSRALTVLGEVPLVLPVPERVEEAVGWRRYACRRTQG